MAVLPTVDLAAKVEKLFGARVLERKPNFAFPIRFNQRSDFTTTRLFYAAVVNDWDNAPVGVPDRIRLHGAARAPGFGEDGFLATVCHEIGHILGGGPKLKPTVVLEAQADDFAARECLPALFRSDPETLEVGKRAPPEVISICSTTSGNAQDQAVCARTILAGRELTLQRHWAVCLSPDPSLRRQAPAGFEPARRDRSRAKVLRDSYPSLQCRLETFISAATGQERASCWFPKK